MNREQQTDDARVVVHVEHLKKYYPVGSAGFRKEQKLLKAVDDVSLDIHEGEIIGIVGESGCGKSTLGRAILRLFPVTDGKIVFKGTDITHMDRKELKEYRRDMQMIFQNPFSSFNPKQRIGNALAEVGKVYGMTEKETDERIAYLLIFVIPCWRSFIGTMHLDMTLFLSASFLYSIINLSFDLSVIIKLNSSSIYPFNSSLILLLIPSLESFSNFKLKYNFAFFKLFFVVTSEISSNITFNLSGIYNVSVNGVIKGGVI